MTDDLEKFRFNRAVARIRELNNAILECEAGAGEAWALRTGGKCRCQDENDYNWESRHHVRPKHACILAGTRRQLSR